MSKQDERGLLRRVVNGDRHEALGLFDEIKQALEAQREGGGNAAR